MSKFNDSYWADTEFSQNYRDDADVFLPFRRQFIEVSKSLYGYFINPKPDPRLLDLGCGDGFFVHELLKSYTPSAITLMDGSAEMLTAAGKRLQNYAANIGFVEMDFQRLIAEQPLDERYDFIYSSLAIHHLPYEEKCRLYAYIFSLLKTGGLFVHYDVVIPSSDRIEKWYLSHWRDWINDCPDRERGERLRKIPDQYKQNPDNLPDSLDAQLQVFEKIGFSEVDCFFRHGIFALFGGFK